MQKGREKKVDACMGQSKLPGGPSPMHGLERNHDHVHSILALFPGSRMKVREGGAR